MKNKTLRNSNIEILRILLILMVIGVHYNLTGMGNAFLYTQNTGINVSLTNALESICIVCVDTFIIICGYFQINKEKIDKRKIIRFIITILFFNLVQYILNIFINNTAFSFRTMISQMLSGKWFIIIYLVLYSLSPFINKLIKTLDIKEYKKLLIILVSIFIVYQTFLSYVNLFMPVMGWSGIIDQGIDKGYTIINFIVLYLIGGYIKKSNINPRLKISACIYLISTVVIFMSWYFLSHFHFDNVSIQYYYNNVFVVLSSISLFLIFNRIKIKNSRIINYISKQTMTVFILSTSPFLLQLYNIMDVEKYSVTNYLIHHFVITCLVIYIASVGIGIIGNLILEKTIFKLIENKKKMEDIIMFKFKKKIKVYFIAQYRAGLDKFASVVDEMKQDNSFDVKVLAVPNDISDLTENKDFDFWKKRFGDITVNALIDKDTWFDLKKEKPDYVFIQRPYDNLVPNVYSKTVISNYTKICYIPYAFSLANLFDIMMPQSEMVYLSIIFAENDEMNEYYEGLIKSIDDKKKRKSYNFGYPSLDEAKKCIESMGSAFDNFKRNKINVLWTPRWSVDKNIIETSFFDYKDSIVKYFKNNKDYNLVFRPHPLTFNNFVEKKIMTQKEVDDYLNKFKDNLHYDQSGRYFNTFGDTDVLITDFSSIIVEFMLFKKPIVYTQKEPYKRTNYLSDLEKVFYKVKNEKELYKVLDELKKGVDPLKEKREKLADELFMKYDGQVAYRIKETIKNDYKK